MKKTAPTKELQSYLNLRWYIRLVWLAILVLGTAGVIQNYVQNRETVAFIYSIAVIIALAFINLFLSTWIKKIRRDADKLELTSTLIIYLDLFAVLGAMVIGSRIDSSIVFIPLVFLIVSVLKDFKFLYTFTASSILLYVGIVLLDYFSILPFIAPDVALRHDPAYVLPLLIYNVVILYTYVFVYTYIVRLKDEREARLIEQASEITKQTRLVERQNKELTEERNLTENANTTLRKKLGELERVYRFSIGREKRIIELKKQLRTQTVNKTAKKNPGAK